MNASDLAEASALYAEYVRIKGIRDQLTAENVGSITATFMNHADPASVVATTVLSDSADVNDVMKAVRRQMLVDLTVIETSLSQLGVNIGT